MAELALRQATIEYQEFGPQDSPHPPVLFVHGILVDGRLWREVAEGVARRGFRSIVPTLPLGSHRIPVREATALSLHSVAEMINDAIVALDLSDVTLVGSDTGGGLCQLVVDAYPDRIGRLVLTNCDAFDKCPPFPFDIVFGLLRGPISIKTLFGQLRLRALRHSPLGFGLLINHPDPDLTSAWLQPCRNGLAHLPRPGSAAASGGHHRSHRRGHPPTPVHQAGHAGVGPTGPLLYPGLGRRLAGLFSNGKLIEVPDAKTFVALDRPDMVMDAIAGYELCPKRALVPARSASIQDPVDCRCGLVVRSKPVHCRSTTTLDFAANARHVGVGARRCESCWRSSSRTGNRSCR